MSNQAEITVLQSPQAVVEISVTDSASVDITAPQAPTVIEINVPGPQGPSGPQGIPGTASSLTALPDVSAAGKVDKSLLYYDAITGLFKLDAAVTTTKLEPYVFNQQLAASIWTINHNLGYIPAVEVFDSGSQEVDAAVSHPSVNQTVIVFSIPLAGFAVVR